MRPLGLGQILDASIALVRRHFRALVLVMLVVTVPISVINALINTSTTELCHSSFGCGDVDEGSRYVADDGAYIAGVGVSALLTLLQYLLAQVACFKILAEGYLDRRAGAGASLAFALRRMHSSLWLGVLSALGAILGFVFLIVPGVYILVAWSVAFPAMLVEGRRGSKALARSQDLVSGRWWPTFGIYLIAYMLTTVATFAIGFGLGALLTIGVDDGSTLGIAITTATKVVAGAVTTPFFAGVAILIYFDLRVRKEGFDLVLLAERLGGGDALAPAPPTSAPVTTVPPPA